MPLVRPAVALALVLSLAACATPRERCVADANRTYDDTLKLLAVTEGNIARGYAVHRQQVPYQVTETCHDSKDRPYACTETRYRTQETPVSIDVAEERRKRAALQASLPGLRANAAERAAQCAVLYPEG